MAQTIYEKIESKALEDAKQIKKAGQDKSLKMQEEVLNSANELANKMIIDAQVIANDLLKTKKTELLQEANQLTLKNRKTIIREAFLKALEKMMEFSDESLTNYVVNLLKGAKITGQEVIKVKREDKSRYLQLFSSQSNSLDKLNKLLGNNFNLRLSEEEAFIQGGFILESDYFDINYSYETVLKDLMNEIEAELATILFEG